MSVHGAHEQNLQREHHRRAARGASGRCIPTLRRGQRHGAENIPLCLAIRNNHYYEARVMGNPVVFKKRIEPDAHVRAPEAPGMGHDVDLKTLEKVAVAKL